MKLEHCHAHPFREEIEQLLIRDSTIPAIVRTKLKYPKISTAMAANATTGASEISANLERAINRAAEAPIERESEMQAVLSELRENNCTVQEDRDLLIWASPKMKEESTEFEDPLHMDSTHQLEISGRDARLYVFAMYNRRGGVSVISLGLGFNESSNTATKALAFVNNLLEKEAPGVLVSDDAAGFRKAARQLWPRTFHR